jgi:predicted glycoside hydrolase/deacetylase ChbG (UPF0249 family)
MIPKDKEVCIIADDCGLFHSLDEEILNLYKSGIVTDLSIVSCGESFEYVIKELLDIGTVPVGVHGCFVNSEQALTGVSFLTDKKGKFRERNSIVIRSLLRPKKFQKHLDLELRAQIRRLVSTGLRVEHIDSHQHLHLLPAAQRVFLDLALEYNLTIRFPSIIKVGARLTSLFLLPCLELMRRNLRRQRWSSIRVYRALGFEYSGRMTASALEFFLKSDETFPKVIMVHPGKRTGDMPERYLAWGFEWESEADSLRNLANPRIQLGGVMRS